MERAIYQEVLYFLYEKEGKIPYHIIYHSVLYVLLLWRVCILLVNAAYEKEKT